MDNKFFGKSPKMSQSKKGHLLHIVPRIIRKNKKNDISGVLNTGISGS